MPAQSGEWLGGMRAISLLSVTSLGLNILSHRAPYYYHDARIYPRTNPNFRVMCNLKKFLMIMTTIESALTCQLPTT